MNMYENHSFNTQAKFAEKLTLLPDTQGVRKLAFWKILYTQ